MKVPDPGKWQVDQGTGPRFKLRRDEKRKERLMERIRELIGERLRIEFWNEERQQALAAKMEQVLSQQLTPYDLAEQLLKNFNE